MTSIPVSDLPADHVGDRPRQGGLVFHAVRRRPAVIDRREEREQFRRADQAAGVRDLDSLHSLTPNIAARETCGTFVIQEKGPWPALRQHGSSTTQVTISVKCPLRAHMAGWQVGGGANVRAVWRRRWMMAGTAFVLYKAVCVEFNRYVRPTGR